MPARCVRGATTVPRDTKNEIIRAASELLAEIIKANAISTDDIVSIQFTATDDLTKAYPAEAARAMGITDAGLCCYAEMSVEGSLRKCLRALVNIESEKKQSEITHIYLRGAVSLRPDLARPGAAGKKNFFAIAIDGPSGSGKSTAARRVAVALGFPYVDTGAMYRAVALYCMDNGIDLSDAASVAASLGGVDLKIKFEDGRQRVILNGTDVTDSLRTQRVAEGSSMVAPVVAVREALVKIQRGVAMENDVVMDGRDIGTHVLPGAGLKIYLDASAETRAERRVGELRQKGAEAVYERVLTEINNRDTRDRTRDASPLKIANGAVYLDTGGMSEDEVAREIINLYEKRRAGVL